MDSDSATKPFSLSSVFSWCSDCHSSWILLLSLARCDSICEWFWGFNAWRWIFIPTTFPTGSVAIFVFKNDCSNVYFDHVLSAFTFDWLKIYVCREKFWKSYHDLTSREQNFLLLLLQNMITTHAWNAILGDFFLFFWRKWGVEIDL